MKQLLSLGLIVLSLVSCNDDEPAPFAQRGLIEPEEAAGPPNNASASLTGMFTSFAHSLSGNASLYTRVDQQRTIQLEDFTMSAGPDVYVLLSRSNNYSKSNTIGIAKLNKGYSNSLLNITIDPSIDLNTHPFVLVYCVEYNSLFGFAELK
jgi:hypothetical protein